MLSVGSQCPIFRQCNLWTVILLFCSVHATSIACLSVLGEASLLCGSSWDIFHLLFPVIGVFFPKFFLTRIEGLRTEDVHCADCNAPWGDVIVILGYRNKIDWTGFDLVHMFTLITTFALKKKKKVVDNILHSTTPHFPFSFLSMS